MKISDPTDELSSALCAAVLVSSSPTASKIEKKLQTKTDVEKSAASSAQCSGSDTSDGNSFDCWTLADNSKIDYGYCGSSISNNTRQYDEKEEGFYITTAINYINGPGHMGHAYEAAIADAITRYARTKYGHAQTQFVTGSDEHGQYWYGRRYLQPFGVD